MRLPGQLRGVFCAARVFFGRASAAAPAPATWISLRLENVIDVRSFSLGSEAARTRCGGGPKHTRNHESSRGIGDEAGTPTSRGHHLMVSPTHGVPDLSLVPRYRLTGFSGALPIGAGPLSWSAICACCCSFGINVSIRLHTS